MRAWLTSFISSGRAERLVWVLLLTGILVLGVYAYTEHRGRLTAENNSSAPALPLIQSLTLERQSVQHQRDSLQALLLQCQGRENQTYINYLTFQQNEAKRIDSARRRSAALSGAQQQGKLAERYPAPRK